MSFVGNKRGQVTIFIVLAVVIVAGIGIYLLISSKVTTIKPTYKSSENPNEYIADCVGGIVREKVTPILKQGGYAKPKLYLTYNDINMSYLCYTILNYYTCINQEPMYIQHLEKEIKKEIKSDVESCFETLSEDYKKKNIVVNMGETSELNVELQDRKIAVIIKKDVSLNDKGDIKDFKEFKTITNSPTYNLARVAMEIVSQEAVFCSSQYLGYQTLYPWVKIKRTDVKSESKVYNIIDRETGLELNMAIRSCSLPAGLF